ncbi:hypothetical protein ABPG75_006715 [Micractinium tetrahymenae]
MHSSTLQRSVGALLHGQCQSVAASTACWTPPLHGERPVSAVCIPKPSSAPMAGHEAEQQHVAVAVNEEEEAPGAESDSDEEQQSCSGSETDSSSEGDGSEAAKQKKKKKKKKKRKGGGGGAAGGSAQPPVDPAARKEGERRFQEAVDHLSHNSEDGMWVKLGGCHLADGKLKKLCEALKANTTVISIDLSDNHLTDEGAKLLAAALRDGRAPDLIDLDLKDNPQIKDEGSSALEELQQHRKTLRVYLGASQPPPPPKQQPGGPLRPGKQGGQQQQQQGGGGGGQSPPPHQQQNGSGGGGGSLADTVKNNPVISKYFAVGNDDAEEAEEEPAAAAAAAGAEEEHMGGLTAAELAQILWDQLEQCLDAPKPDIPAVSEPLRAIAEQVEHEMDNCELPLAEKTEMFDLKTFTQWALRKLHVLHSVLDLVPPALLTPYSKETPVPAVGTHRTAVAELLAQLLRAQCPLVAHEVAASGLLRRCAVIAVEHPNCSPIHGAVGCCLRLSLTKSMGAAGLWQQLLGSAPVAAPRGAVSEDRGGSLNLAVEAALIAAGARDAPTIGKRPSNVGFALAVGQVLHAAATGEQLGPAAAAAAAAAANGSGDGGERAASGEGSTDGGSSSSSGETPLREQQEQQGQGSKQGQEGEQPAGSSPPPEPEEEVKLAGSQLLAEKPERHTGLHRVPSETAMPRIASAAVSDLPDEGDGWERQLQLALATAEQWVEFSSGPDSLLRRMLDEQVGDLGGPRPRPGAEPEPDSDEGDGGHGQIISGQELLMMLRGLNLGGFSGM